MTRRFWLAVLIAIVMSWTMLPAPMQASGGKIHVVRRGETLSGIAARYGVSIGALAKTNHIKNRNRIYVGMRLQIPGRSSGSNAGSTSKGATYKVKRGDTLSAIGRRFGVSVAALKAANGIKNANRIRVGQRLVIPKRGSTPSTSPAPSPSGGKKWIEIDLSRQRLIAHEGDKIILNTLVSTGLRRTPTPIGTYRVRVKIRRQTMSGPGYRLPNVQWVMYFVGAYALHGTYWHNNFGHPMSHGCVNLRNSAARTLYQWANKGTRVVIHR